MNFSQAIYTCMSKYVTFSGRASRSEFWWFFLFAIILSLGVALVEVAMFGVEARILSDLVLLAIILPVFASGSRRLHDVGKSGWWQLLILTVIGAILLIVWWASDTKPSGDRFSVE